jgi:hypothetical protein
MSTQRRIIRADGHTERLDHRQTAASLAQLLGVPSVHRVPLRNLGEPLRMLVLGSASATSSLPLNEAATRLVLSNRPAGYDFKVYGDAAVVPAEDLA